MHMIQRMIWQAPLLAAITLLLCVAIGGEKPVQTGKQSRFHVCLCGLGTSGKERLIGVWEIVSVEEQGELVPKDAYPYRTLILCEDKFTFVGPEELEAGQDWKVNLGTTPAEIELLPNVFKCDGYRSTCHTIEKTAGVFMLDKDTLKLCLAANLITWSGCKQAPRVLNSQSEGSQLLLLKRVHSPDQAIEK
jgi:uncharacterized protein (TIGR03067 family)